jgi:hypothetical protein
MMNDDDCVEGRPTQSSLKSSAHLCQHRVDAYKITY